MCSVPPGAGAGPGAGVPGHNLWMARGRRCRAAHSDGGVQGGSGSGAGGLRRCLPRRLPRPLATPGGTGGERGRRRVRGVRSQPSAASLGRSGLGREDLPPTRCRVVAKHATNQRDAAFVAWSHPARAEAAAAGCDPNPVALSECQVLRHLSEAARPRKEVSSDAPGPSHSRTRGGELAEMTAKPKTRRGTEAVAGGDRQWRATRRAR